MTSVKFRRAFVLFCLALCSLSAAHAWAHTAKLSVLVLREQAPGRFISSWERTQGIDDQAAAYDLLRPVFPEHCHFQMPRLNCGEAGLSGRIGFEGLGDLSTAGMIEIQWASGKSQLLSLTAADPQVRVSADRQAGVGLRSFGNFVGMGVLHICGGWDHLLFVLGLLWFLPSRGALLKTITAFTVAHSSTLAAASFGALALPSAAVEAVIALSIAFVAVEIIHERKSGRASLTRRKPWLVAFSFGLLHGFGFAGALSELQLSRAELPFALLGFNVGVELGQLVFVAALLALRPPWRRLEQSLGSRLATVGYYAMGTLAMYWFFERVALFWPSPTPG